MALIDDILDRRREDGRYDEPLWELLDEVARRPLREMTTPDLQARLDHIDRGIQFLDVGPSGRDELPPERGWLSPWWWLRARHWTLAEMSRRPYESVATPTLPVMPRLRPEFQGVVAGGRRLLVRIGREPHLIETVERGRLRFAPAQGYAGMTDLARADDELRKSYRRPGGEIAIVRENGRPMQPVGEVAFSTARIASDGTTEIPYWLMSFSSDLDPRLVAEFPSEEHDEAILVIFDPIAFVRRALPVLARVAPHADVSLFPTSYFDPHYRPGEPLSALKSKELRFAPQREMRMVLDPGRRGPVGGGDAMFVDVGSLVDIAAVYRPEGRLIVGTGPEGFLA